MKIVFNDATELQAQSVTLDGDKLLIKTISASRDELKVKFQDSFATARMDKVENGRVIDTYKGYTKPYRIEEYFAGILGVVMYKEDETPEVQAELMKSAVKVAKMQVQDLSDEQALTVKNLYEEYKNLIGQTVKLGYKLLHEGKLYKSRQESLLIQEQYIPGESGTESLFERIDEEHSGTLEDPVSYTGNMELEQGKYYEQFETVYLCIRSTGQAVTHNLSELIGIYVEVIE